MFYLETGSHIVCITHRPESNTVFDVSYLHLLSHQVSDLNEMRNKREIADNIDRGTKDIHRNKLDARIDPANLTYFP